MAEEFRVTDSVVSGRDGDIRTRDYLPQNPTTQAPLLWVHGGGFVLGGLDQVESDAPARYLAARGRWVRTIDYRLAPNIGLFKNPRLGEAPGRFPEAHHDVIDVAQSLRDSAGRIHIGGASAGANLVAGALASMKNDRVRMPVSAVLVYGTFHNLLPENTAVEAGLTGPIARWFFNPAMTRRINLNYVGTESGLAEPYAFPGGTDLAGFPPSLTLDATNDRLRRSGHQFHLELLAAGIMAEELVVQARHGFLGSPRGAAFATGMAAIDSWLTRRDSAAQ